MAQSKSCKNHSSLARLNNHLISHARYVEPCTVPQYTSSHAMNQRLGGRAEIQVAYISLKYGCTSISVVD